MIEAHGDSGGSRVLPAGGPRDRVGDADLDPRSSRRSATPRMARGTSSQQRQGHVAPQRWGGYDDVAMGGGRPVLSGRDSRDRADDAGLGGRHSGRVSGKRRSPRVGWWVGCLILGALWLSPGHGPGSGADAQERVAAQPGGAYRRPLANDPATLDPARQRDIYSLAVGQQLFDGLVEFTRRSTSRRPSLSSGSPPATVYLDVHASERRQVPPRTRGDGGRRRLLLHPAAGPPHPDPAEPISS